MAYFAILQLIFATVLLAFTPTAAPRQGGRLNLLRLHDVSNRRREYRTIQQNKRQSRQASLEYQRALDSLHNNPAHQNVSSILLSDALIPREQVHLIEELQRLDRYEAILDFLEEDHHHSIPKTVWQAAIIALSHSPKHHARAVNLCLENAPLLSPDTCAALFRGVSSIVKVESLLERLQSLKTATNVTQNVQVWNAAMSACRRCTTNHHADHWQTCLTLLRQMKRCGVIPNERTYGHVLSACAQSGQVKIALSLLQEAQQKHESKLSPQLWGAALHACAKADNGWMDAISILQYMTKHNVDVNAIHVSAFVSSCAKAERDDVARMVLECLHRQVSIKLDRYNLTIAPIPMDLVVVNTVLLACAKAGNYAAAKQILNNLKQGLYEGVEPDVISYNTVLSACTDPDEAKELVKEVSFVFHNVSIVLFVAYSRRTCSHFIYSFRCECLDDIVME